MHTLSYSVLFFESVFEIVTMDSIQVWIHWLPNCTLRAHALELLVLLVLLFSAVL